MSGSHDTVLVVNFGGQYAHLIARRLRELGAYAILTSPGMFGEVLEGSGDRVKAVVLSGGPMSVRNLAGRSEVCGEVLGSGLPVLGICFGHQLLAVCGGGVVGECEGEFGRAFVRVVRDDPLFEGWSGVEEVWMSHRECVTSLPEGAEVLAVSGRGYKAAFRFKDSLVYGVQFHPEVRHTRKGKVLLRNFLRLAGVELSWRPANILEEILEGLRRELGGSKGRVVAAISGGVDSAVAAALVRKVVGDRLVPVLVDHGLFREGEVGEVVSLLKSLGLDPLVIDARERFLSRLEGVEDCEERRRIIGEEFAAVFKEVAESLGDVEYLVQGTTFPDVIESGCVESADRIKSHHNVAGLPEWLGLKVVEPLRGLYKDEVRELGRLLGLPERIIGRHPFPGPGLAVRVVGRFSRAKLGVVRRASRILEEELRRAGLYSDVWQAFAIVGDDRWVGVKGDSREVGYIVTLRVVSSEDAMTADWVRLPYDVLDRVASRITSEVEGVTMVTYAVTPKPPSTIEPC